MLTLLLPMCHMLLMPCANTASPSDPGLALSSLAHWKWHRRGALNHGSKLQLRMFHVEWTHCCAGRCGPQTFLQGFSTLLFFWKIKSQEISRLQPKWQASTSRYYYCSEHLQVVHTVPSIYHRVLLLQRAAFWKLPFTFDHISLSSLTENYTPYYCI